LFRSIWVQMGEEAEEVEEVEKKWEGRVESSCLWNGGIIQGVFANSINSDPSTAQRRP
jgi:hypothetical protein